MSVIKATEWVHHYLYAFMFRPKEGSLSDQYLSIQQITNINGTNIYILNE